ncbi:MAG: phosphoglycerate mutase [Verrucomicrobia bacterium RIFCSPHIGHO2_12_FULL_41_10]|nr:MAG: phosphoglycerate mutase [Verrucomicrobia bacterium RIFCSPHIGHO2_12_FULL_41_10]HLB33695.1 histidine phosphatase family protein [Chthoniobacterales bacterium]
MKPSFPKIYLARHGETAWSRSGQHTGRTDMPLVEQGEKDAKLLGARLQKLTFDKVISSPLQRAMNSCILGGFGERVEAEPLLLEWNYGDYEGLKTTEIRAKNPNWSIFRDGCPDGESPDQIAARCDELIAKLRSVNGDVLLFSHAHVLRMLTARWLGQPPANSGLYFLNTASLSILGYYHDLTEPVIHLWNDTSHLG